MKTRIVLLSAALLMLAAPLFAGSGEKCTYGTQACLNHWASSKDMGWTGLELDKSVEGVVKVKAVTPDSPAASAGFQPGDVLLTLNGVKMSEKAALKKAKGSWKAGQSVTYTVERAGAEQTLGLTLATTPELVYASMLGTHMMENHGGGCQGGQRIRQEVADTRVAREPASPMGRRLCVFVSNPTSLDATQCCQAYDILAKTCRPAWSRWSVTGSMA